LNESTGKWKRIRLKYLKAEFEIFEALDRKERRKDD